MVEPNFFSLCGAKPYLGRTFLPEESQPGNDGVTVLSAGLWERRFGADPSVIGRTIHLDGRPVIVVGVMPESFRFPLAADLWQPLAPDQDFWARRDLHNLAVLGKLKPGQTIARANSELNAIENRLGEIYPATVQGWHVLVTPIRSYAVGNDARNDTFILLWAAGLALLLVCANIANLQFVRGASRTKEIAIRAAMGGSRWRIIRQLLTESTLIALGGAVLGLLVARWTISNCDFEYARRCVQDNRRVESDSRGCARTGIHDRRGDGRGNPFRFASGDEEHAIWAERNTQRKRTVEFKSRAASGGCGAC